MADAWQRHRFFEGLARALIAVGRPMLLVLDNVQWCDQETLAFLTFCLGLAAGARSWWPGRCATTSLDEDPELADWTVRMRATGLLTELSLSPLEAADTARLAEAISGQPLPEADADLLQATTGGFPLYVIEAVRGTADPGGTPLPAGDLAAVLRKRLEQATAAAREVAGLAAAVGHELHPRPAHRGERPRRRHRRGGASTSCGGAGSCASSATATTSPTTCSAKRPTRRSARRNAGCCTGASPRGSSCSTPTTPTRSRPSSPSSTPGAGGPSGRWPTTGGPPTSRRAGSPTPRRSGCTRRRWRSSRPCPRGETGTASELAVLEAMAAPLNARYGYASPELQQALERSIALAESLGRKDSTLTGLVALWASQFVQGRTADGYQTATRALALVDPGSELSGPAHFAVGGSAVSLGMPAEGLRHLELAAKLASGAVSLSVGTRPDVHGTAWAAHAHWLLGHDDDALSACREAIRLARAIDHPYSLAVALAYGSITHQMRGDLAELRDTVGELRELCDRYGFAYYREWALILDGWSRADGSGIDLARRGIGNLKSEGAFARMPYWLSLLADLPARRRQPDAARATLDAALAAAHAHDDVWWLPEVMRMRAAYDDERGRRRAAALRRAAGVGARQRRAAPALRARPRRRAAFAFPLPAFSRRPSASARRERCANAAAPTFGVHELQTTHPKGDTMTTLSRLPPLRTRSWPPPCAAT